MAPEQEDEDNVVLPLLRNNTRLATVNATPDDQAGSTLISRRTLRLASLAAPAHGAASFATRRGSGSGCSDAHSTTTTTTTKEEKENPPALLRKVGGPQG